MVELKCLAGGSPRVSVPGAATGKDARGCAFQAAGTEPFWPGVEMGCFSTRPLSPLSFLAAAAAAFSSEPPEPRLYLRVASFNGRRPALLPPGLAGLPDGQCSAWGIGWVAGNLASRGASLGLASAVQSWPRIQDGWDQHCTTLFIPVPAHSVWKPYCRAARWFVPCSRGPSRA